MSIREEFEKAFWQVYPGASGHGKLEEVKDDMEIALWGANWVAECLAKSAEGCLGSLTAIQIRKRAKELLETTTEL